MGDAWVDVSELKSRLRAFFSENGPELSRFGSKVNQTFEAYVFAQVIAWYKARPGWIVEMVNPLDDEGRETFRLKFSTRGRPGKYSFVRCTSPDGVVLQVRHQLRVATRHHKEGRHGPAANICLDVAVIADRDLSGFSTYDFIPNGELVTFGEAKHMSAFAELVASFIGLVHEVQPERLRRVRTKRRKTAPKLHPAPFLFVSGRLLYTGEGLTATIVRRAYDVDVYSKSRLLAPTFALPTARPPSVPGESIAALRAD